MKITALIGFILTFLATIFVTIIFGEVLTASSVLDPTYRDLFALFSFSLDFRAQGVFMIILYLGFMLMFISGCFKTNKVMMIGSILCTFSLFLSLVGWLSATPSEYIYNNAYQFGAILFAISFIVYFVGLIKFRDKNKVAWIFGIFVLIIVIVANIGIGFLAFGFSGLSAGLVNTHLFTLIIQYFFLAILGLIFSFSKKSAKWEGYQAEDELSVSSGSAFASYVPEDSAYTSNNSPKSDKKKKKKKQGSSDDFDFNF